MRFMVWEIVLGVGSEEQMDVVRHHDEGMEFVVAFGAVVLEGFEEEFGVVRELEEAVAIVSDGGDEEGAFRGDSRGDGHGRSLWVVRAVVKEERRAFGRAGARSARLIYGMRERMPFRSA